MTELIEETEHKFVGQFANIAVAGLGLIGASVSQAIKNMDPNVYIFGTDIDGPTCAVAVQKGMVNQAVSSPDDEDFRTFVQEKADLVILATPIGASTEYIDRLAAWGYTGIATDTASTKAHISAYAAEHMPNPANYVPGHPMAGSEVNGIAGARPEMFKGCHWILCPDEDTPAETFLRLHELVTSLGARVVSLPREEHDNAVAVVSHVPHFMAASLVTLANRHADEQKSLMRLAAGGFKDSTRIAAGSPKLWTGIAFDNYEALHSGLEEMREIIESFASALENGDRDKITELLTNAAEARRALPVAWLPNTEKLLEVRIPMQDRKGVVAEATTIASSAGCNIQSIDIDHVTENSAVLSLILTDEGDIGKLSSALIMAGFSVSFSPLSPKEHSHV